MHIQKCTACVASLEFKWFKEAIRDLTSSCKYIPQLVRKIVYIMFVNLSSIPFPHVRDASALIRLCFN